MMKTFTFDTDIFSYYIKGNEEIKTRLNRELSKGNSFIINPITYYEISRGLLAIDNREKLHKFQALCQIFGILELTNSALDVAAQNYAILRKNGELIEDADLFIAAVCISNDLVLITNNKKHFSRIRDLNIESWIER